MSSFRSTTRAAVALALLTTVAGCGERTAEADPASGGSGAADFEGTYRSRDLQITDEVVLWRLLPEELEERYWNEADEAARDEVAAALFALSYEELVRGAAEAESEWGRPGVESSEESYDVKGNVMRTDLPEDQVAPFDYALVSDGGMETTYVNDGERFFVTVNLEEVMRQAREQMESMGIDPGEGGGDAEPPELDLERIGSETVNGFSTDVYRVRREGKITHAWVTRDEPGLYDLMMRFRELAEEQGPSMDEEGEDVEGLVAEQTGGLPVRVATLVATPGGGLSSFSVSEIVSIEEKSFPDAHFRVPSGYDERTMAQEMGGQGGG